MLQHVIASPAPSALEPPKLTPKSRGLQIFDRLLSAQARLAARNLRLFYQSDDSRGPHQARVALRRLRSLLKLYRPKLASDPVRAIEALAKEEMRRIGPLRDADVLLADILPTAADALGAPETHAALRDQVAKHREMLGRRIRSGPAALASAELLFDLQAFVAERPWTPRRPARQKLAAAPARRLAAFALDRSLRPARRLGERLDDLTIDERHDLRKALKTLRYAVQLHAPLYPSSATDPYVAALRKLQNTFGALNDAANAEMLREIAPAPEFSGAVAAIIDMQHERMLSEWPKAQRRWRTFAALAPFW